MPLGAEVNLGPGYVVLDGVAAPPKRAQPQFLVHVSCGQTAGWMKTEVDLGPSHIVLAGTQLPLMGHSSPLFSARVFCGHGRPFQLLLSSCLK